MMSTIKMPPTYARLRDEWLNHGGLILAVDFDDTVFPYKMLDSDSVAKCFEVIAAVRKAHHMGCRVVMWTASDPDRYDFIRRYMEEHGIRVEAVNQNLPGLRYGNNGKIYANLYMDDRGGLSEALTTLIAVTKEVDRLTPKDDGPRPRIVIPEKPEE